MFPNTRWTLILASRQGQKAERAALEQLLTIYWRPLYFYLRRRGVDTARAEDVVQGFFLQLMERDFLARLDPARGRLRSYLLTALEHYRVNLHEGEAARKRGGDFRFVPLDVVLAERELAAAPAPPEAAYEREWALGLMERALTALRRDYDTGRRKGDFEIVARFFRLDGAALSYADAACACGMTVPQFKASLHRARARFREILRDEVAATLEGDSDIEDELAGLVRALSA
jgi:RNA polymerase sigma factor (sigma-70 family)